MRSVDSHLNKSKLVSPTSEEIAKLADQSRKNLPDHPSIIERHTLPRNIKRRLSPETREALSMRHKTGETVRALSKEFGVSESALRDLLVTEVVQFREHSITSEDIDLAVQLYESGLTVRQVVKQVEHPIGTIRRVLRERGVSMRLHSTRRSES